MPHAHLELTFVISADYARRTGGYVFAERLLAGLQERGWRLQRLTLPAGFPDPSPAARARSAALLRALPDRTLVLADQLCLGVLPEVAKAEGRRLRLVMIVHHPLALESPHAAAAARQSAVREREALAHCERVLVTSEATARTLVGEYAVPRRRIIVAVPGVDRAPLAAGRRRGPLLLVCVGAVVPRKDHGALIRALAAARQHPWRLVIVGNVTRAPAHVRALRALIAGLALRPRITLAGELSPPALARHWARADLYVTTSRHEGYGMAVAEAIAHGLPVVATRAGAVGQWLGRGAGVVVRDGYHAELAHTLKRVLASPERRACLRRGAVSRRRTLATWERAIATVSEALASLADVSRVR
jgi:glycosyltransferase involved in cell wall biosynthesis